ncbi:hypothetical protein L218DRAFT_997142 [Marasmius fiardii PR-910]|nr:hypothetical protein L218DRAFT_997142 [Marasmius fiardii PR-910]
MSSKTLSTGTLSLRFMQNARDRQSKEVQLEKAHVEDDGQWEVAKEVRESWGVSQTKQNISSENSYLPFLFPPFSSDQGSSTADTNTTPSSSHNDSKLFKGRRVFQKGKEVHEQVLISALPFPHTQSQRLMNHFQFTQSIAESSTAPQAHDQEIAEDHERKATQSGKGKKAAARLTMLSKSKSGEPAGLLKPGRAIAKSLPTAKLAIFDSSGVGTDLSASSLLSSTKSEKTATSSPPAFVKPAGVDDPHQSSSVLDSGARERKRAPVAEQDGLKRKKKKKSGD